MIVDKKAGHDLLRAISRYGLPRIELLIFLKDNVSYLAEIDTHEQEARAVDFLSNKMEKEIKNIRPLIGCEIRTFLAELQYYPPEHRAMIVDEALKECLYIWHLCELLEDEKRQAEVVKAWRLCLSPKERAIVKVAGALIAVGCELNTDYLNTLFDVEGDVDLLRDDPAFETILKAYDLAETYLETVD